MLMKKNINYRMPKNKLVFRSFFLKGIFIFRLCYCSLIFLPLSPTKLYRYYLNSFLIDLITYIKSINSQRSFGWVIWSECFV